MTADTGHCSVCDRLLPAPKPVRHCSDCWESMRRASAQPHIAGEIKRARHKLTLLGDTIDSVRRVIEQAEQRGVPIGPDVQQALVGSATDLALTLARLQAYMHAGES